MDTGKRFPDPLNRVAGRGVGPSTQLHSSDILLSFDAVSARRSLDLMGRDEGIDVFRRARENYVQLHTRSISANSPDFPPVRGKNVEPTLLFAPRLSPVRLIWPPAANVR